MLSAAKHPVAAGSLSLRSFVASVPLRCLLVFALLAAVVFSSADSAAAQQPAPVLTIDEEVSAFAFAPDGRIAYAVRHVFGERRLQVQRDDIWVSTLEGKKTRIIEGQKLFRGAAPFSYAVQALRWSPDGARLAVEMYTSTMTDAHGETKEGYVTWLLDASGKEIKNGGGPGMIEDAANSAWLTDGATVAFIHEAVQPKLLFDIRTLRPAGSRGESPFEGRTFSAVAWDLRPASGSFALAIERSPTLTGPVRLVWLDLQTKERRELAQLAGYAGQLSVSPSGKFVAYFREQETLEFREVAHPERVARVRVAFGAFAWAGDERVLIKRGTFETGPRGSGRRSGTLAWLSVPPLQAEPVASASADVTAKESQSATGRPVSPEKRAPAPIRDRTLSAGQNSPAGNLQLTGKNPPEAELRPALSDLTYQGFAISPDGRYLAVTAPGARPLQVFPVR
jgi:hypothetical protein